MENLDYGTYHKIILDHPLFRSLDGAAKEALPEYYFVQEYLKGEQIVFSEDVQDSLYVVLEGRVFRQGGEAEPRSFRQGDFWGCESLFSPGGQGASYTALDDTLVVRLRAEGFRRFLRAHPGSRRGFKPVVDAEGRHISGFPPAAWKVLRSKGISKEGLIHFQGRTSRKSFSLFLLLPGAMMTGGLSLLPRSLWFGLLAGAGLLIAFCELFLRSMTLYRIGDKTALRRYFNWRNFRREQEELPLDRIKSVQINVKGPIRKIMSIGDLSIQTPGRGIVFRNIDHPAELQKKLMALKSSALEEEGGRDKETFRELVREKLYERRDAGYAGQRSAPANDGPEGGKIFRKSPAVLIGDLLLPLGIMVLTVFTGIVASGRLPMPVLVLLWLVRGAAFFRMLWKAMDWWNDIYKIELPFIWDIERKPFATEEQRTQTDLSGILNVRVFQKGLFPILLNYGDVIIETPGDSGSLEFYSVARPLQVQSEIFRYRDFLKKSRVRQEREDSLKEFGQFAEILKQVRSNEVPDVNTGYNNAAGYDQIAAGR